MSDSPSRRPPSWLSVLAAILASIATIIGTFAVVDDGTKTVRSPVAPAKAAPTITTEVNAAPGDGQPTAKIEVPAAAVNEAKAATHSDLKDETPAVAVRGAPDQLAAQQQLVEKVKRTQDGLPTAGATAGVPGCRTVFVRNQSSRNGVRPQWIVLHYTVSGNRPGWSDVNAIVAFFNTSSAQASSHFVIDGEGNCAYIVPIESKAWANAAGNSLSVQIEVVNSGRETQYLAPAGQAKLLQVERTISARTGIPLRAGSVSPFRSGVVQHRDGGLAWGGHVDIAPFSIVQQQALASAPAKLPITSRERSACRSVAAYRQRERQRRAPGGKNPRRTKKGTAAFKRNVKLVGDRRHRCVGGRVKRRR